MTSLKGLGEKLSRLPVEIQDDVLAHTGDPRLSHILRRTCNVVSLPHKLEPSRIMAFSIKLAQITPKMFRKHFSPERVLVIPVKSKKNSAYVIDKSWNELSQWGGLSCTVELIRGFCVRDNNKFDYERSTKIWGELQDPRGAYWNTSEQFLSLNAWWGMDDDSDLEA